jgi:hypothetical protein
VVSDSQEKLRLLEGRDLVLDEVVHAALS